MDKGKPEEMTIDLMDLWRIFVSRLLLMIVVAVIFMGAFFVYTKLTYVPRYQSTATLYVLRTDREKDNESSYEVNSDFSLAMNVVNDCTYLLEDAPVLNKVIKELKLDMTSNQLAGCITTENPEESRILEVSVEASSPKQAQKIVNKICEIGAEEIEDAMGFRQVSFYAKGDYNPNPCNQTSLLRYLEVGAVGGILVYMLFVLQYLLDDGIRSNEDVEKYLGLVVLGEIPNLEMTHDRKYGYEYSYKEKKSIFDFLSSKKRKGKG